MAFSGERGVAKVEYSIDGEELVARLDVRARFGSPGGGYQIEATLPAGVDTIYTRAIDTEGDVQPNYVENERGYGNNSSGWITGSTSTDSTLMRLLWSLQLRWMKKQIAPGKNCLKNRYHPAEPVTHEEAGAAEDWSQSGSVETRCSKG